MLVRLDEWILLGERSERRLDKWVCVKSFSCCVTLTLTFLPPSNTCDPYECSEPTRTIQHHLPIQDSQLNYMCKVPVAVLGNIFPRLEMRTWMSLGGSYSTYHGVQTNCERTKEKCFASAQGGIGKDFRIWDFRISKWFLGGIKMRTEFLNRKPQHEKHMCAWRNTEIIILSSKARCKYNKKKNKMEESSGK